jgi:hypothetical protein
VTRDEKRWLLRAGKSLAHRSKFLAKYLELVNTRNTMCNILNFRYLLQVEETTVVVLILINFIKTIKLLNEKLRKMQTIREVAKDANDS